MGFYLGFKFWGGGSHSMTNLQDMHVDLMQVLYVYSRVMGVCVCVITKYRTLLCILINTLCEMG